MRIDLNKTTKILSWPFKIWIGINIRKHDARRGWFLIICFLMLAVILSGLAFLTYLLFTSANNPKDTAALAIIYTAGILISAFLIFCIRYTKKLMRRNNQTFWGSLKQ